MGYNAISKATGGGLLYIPDLHGPQVSLSLVSKYLIPPDLREPCILNRPGDQISSGLFEEGKGSSSMGFLCSGQETTQVFLLPEEERVILVNVASAMDTERIHTRQLKPQGVLRTSLHIRYV